MIKILFLINTLGGGGAERVLINLVNNMDPQKFDITVETMLGEGSNRISLTDRVRYSHKDDLLIPGLSYLLRLFPAKLLYRHYIRNENYDIIVAYMHGVPTKVVSGCPDPRIRKVTWLHNGNPVTGSFFRFWLTQKDAIKAYDSLDAIVGVSESVTKAFSDYTGIKDKCYTLYNTNDIQRVQRLAGETVEKVTSPLICTVGNLATTKGYDRLIQAVHRLSGKQFKLWIIGEGAERKNLESIIHKYKLEDKVVLCGFKENPYKFMAKADLFVSSSREEGLATVLLEALALGLPVISTDVSGAKEVLGNNNEYGLIVENSENGIYEGLKRFLDDTHSFDHYREVAKERAEFFSVENTVGRTEAFFESLIEKG